jgi:hypothetical protein
MTLAAACDSLKTLLGAATGIVRAYGDPPSSISEFPALIVYPHHGSLEVVSAGLRRGLHVIAVDIIQSRQSISDAVDLAKEWPERVLAILDANQSLAGTVDAIVWPVDYRIMPMRYGQDLLFGARFEIRVKILS